MSSESDLIDGLIGMLRLPMRALMAGMDAAAAAVRQAQALYDAGLDVAAQGAQGVSGVAATARAGGDPGRGTAADIPDSLVRDTLNGLVAFVVPGPDAYSMAQGETTAEPGGLEAGITEALITAFELSQPSPPQGPRPSAAVAGLLNQVAQHVNPGAAGGFASPFANLSFAEKAAVFGILEQDPAMAQFRRLAGLLLFVPAALAYSEIGAVNCQTARLGWRPIGWTISRYEGAADGCNELKGYFQGRREPERSTHGRDGQDLRARGRARRA